MFKPAINHAIKIYSHVNLNVQAKINKQLSNHCLWWMIIMMMMIMIMIIMMTIVDRV